MNYKRKQDRRIKVKKGEKKENIFDKEFAMVLWEYVPSLTFLFGHFPPMTP